MRFPASYFIPSVISLAATVRGALESSDSLFLSEDETTSDLFPIDNVDEFTTTTIAGENDVNFLTDDSYDEIPLDFETPLTSPGGEIANGEADASSCTQPLGKRDISDDDLILGEYQTSFYSQ